MPIYEYECDNCEKVIEKWHSINDSSPDKCDCGGNLTKIISRTTFHLKGSGWYVTDYCKKNSNDKVNSKTSNTKDVPSDSTKTTTETPVSPATSSSQPVSETTSAI